MAESIRKIAARRGYMAIQIRERGNVPRNMKKAFNLASKSSWAGTAKHFHANFRDKRFTPEHAVAAGYEARQGQKLPPDSKAFRKSYYGIKLRSSRLGGGAGKANPLVKSGETRKAVRQAAISSTSKRGRAAYSGARVFNRRSKSTRIRMDQEFRRLTNPEIQELAKVYDDQLDQNLAKNDQ